MEELLKEYRVRFKTKSSPRVTKEVTVRAFNWRRAHDIVLDEIEDVIDWSIDVTFLRNARCMKKYRVSYCLKSCPSTRMEMDVFANSSGDACDIVLNKVGGDVVGSSMVADQIRE